MADLAPPPGFVPIDQPPPGFVPISDKPQGWNAVAANAGTGLLGGLGNLYGLPNTLARAYQNVAQGLGQPSPGADFIAANTPSPGDVNRIVFGDINKASTALTGAPTSLPYTPETGWGRVGQAALSNVVPSLVSGGAAGMGTRIASGMAGGAAGQAYANANPNDYWGQLLASMGGALAGGVAGQGLGAAGAQIPPMVSSTAAKAAAEQTVGREIAAAPPVPAWPGGPLLPGTPTPSESSGSFVSNIVGPALGFGAEHLLGGEHGGIMGMYAGKLAGDFLHHLAGAKTSAALADVRQRMQSDPVYAAQLLQQYNPPLAWPPYLAQRIPYAALPPSQQ
jgi:hypothetical protein